MLSFFIAYGCKKKEVTPDDRPWNQQFVGTYVGKMSYRNFYAADVGPWILKDSVIVIGTDYNEQYNTTSLQHIPSIRFGPGGSNPAPSGPLTIFRFEKNFKRENYYLYYHGKTASGAGQEIEFYGVKKP